MNHLAALMLLAALALPACGGTDRPEGVVERWLVSLNQGASRRRGLYARDRLSQEVLPGWQSCDPGALDKIEVGRGIGVSRHPDEADLLVPFRVENASDIASLCGRDVQILKPLDK